MTALNNAHAALAKIDANPWIDDRTCAWFRVDRHDMQATREALRDLIAEHERACEALTDMAEFGLRFDLNPTLMLSPADSVYSQWAAYARRMDASIRERAAAALNDRSE